MLKTVLTGVGIALAVVSSSYGAGPPHTSSLQTEFPPGSNPGESANDSIVGATLSGKKGAP